MSQYDWGPMDPTVTSGTTLAADLNSFRSALNSCHSGSSRPAYAVAKTSWVNDATSPWQVYMFDGATDVLLGTLDSTGHVFTPNMPNTPAGNIASTTVQAALNELDTEKAPLASPTLTGTPAVPTATIGTNSTQAASTAFVQTAVSTAIATIQGVPAGAVEAFARSTAPTGWLKANGAVITIASYSTLATAIYCGDTLNPTALFGYKTSDAGGTTRSTTGGYMVLPDLRGHFIRGFDDGRGVDSGRVFGSAQSDDLKSHIHPVGIATTIGGSQTGLVVGTLSLSDPSGTRVNAVGGTETRPLNTALLVCIKY